MGDTIIVRKAGDVIPEVVGPVIGLRPEDAQPWQMPAECPSCGSPVWRPEGEVVTRCTNVACPAQRLERLLHWAGRGAMDIDGLGYEITQRLIDRGLLARRCRLLRARTAEKLASLDTGRLRKDGTPVVLGEVVAAKIAANIEASRHRPLSRVLFGLGIRHVGSTVAEAIADHMRSIDAIASASADEIAAVEGVGPVIASSIRAFFDNAENLAVVARLARARRAAGRRRVRCPTGRRRSRVSPSC